MKLLFKVCFLSTAICFGHIGCASAASNAGKTLVKAEAQNGYTKPGASVALRHDYKGQTSPGQRGEMTVDVIMQPTDGIVSVSFSASEGLSLLSGADAQTFQVSRDDFSDNGSPLGERKLSFRADEDGRYYVSAFVSITDPSGITQSRVVAMPVPIGTGVVKAKTNGVLGTDTQSGRAIIIMEAEETVIK